MADEAVWLNDRGAVRVSGEDAAGFLQGVLTNDVEKLAPREARYAALLTPQGKILFDFLVVRLSGEPGAGVLLDCPAALASDLAKRLGFYKLRAKVTVADESADHGIVAYVGDGPEIAPGAIRYADPRAEGLGAREILPRARAESIGTNARAAYEARRISLGVPAGGVDFAFGDAFPADADMDLLNGVDFAKGCYVGQEVVSRMRHRGGVRKRILRVRLDGEAPAVGTPVLDGELPVGVLGGSAGGEALALLRLDRIEEAKAAGRRLTAGEAVVTPLDFGPL